MKQRYDYDFLLSYVSKHNITLTNDYTHTNINTFIDYQCVGCCVNSRKRFKWFVKLPFCQSCSKLKSHKKRKLTCLEKYGHENASQSMEVQNKMKATCVDRYGHENASQSMEVQNKRKATCVDRYGVENPFQNTKVQEKMKATCVDRYGVEYASQSMEVQNKMKATCVDRYGVEYPQQNPEIAEKMKATCLRKYGVENPQQNPEIAEKTSRNAYKSYDYTLPSGKEIRLQGYEKYAMDILLENGIQETDLLTDRSKVPEICYEVDGREHRYFIDIFIPSKNLGIEVKSTWTLDKNREKVNLKQDAFKKAGYNCEIWVMNDKGVIIEKIE